MSQWILLHETGSSCRVAAESQSRRMMVTIQKPLLRLTLDVLPAGYAHLELTFDALGTYGYADTPTTSAAAASDAQTAANALAAETARDEAAAQIQRAAIAFLLSSTALASSEPDITIRAAAQSEPGILVSKPSSNRPCTSPHRSASQRRPPNAWCSPNRVHVRLMRADKLQHADFLARLDEIEQLASGRSSGSVHEKECVEQTALERCSGTDETSELAQCRTKKARARRPSSSRATAKQKAKPSSKARLPAVKAR
jgi:hypothetical protein